MNVASDSLAARVRPVCIHAIPLCAASALYLLAEPHTVLLAGGMIATCTYLYLLHEECQKNQLVLTPLTCFLLWFALVLGPTSIYVALRFAEDNSLAFLLWLVPLQAVAAGYLITLLGACSLHLGLVLGLLARAERFSNEPVEHAALSIPALLACVVVSALFARYARSLLFAGSTVGYLLAGLGPAAACLYASSTRHRFRHQRVKVMILLPVAAILAWGAGGSGSKLAIFSAAIPLLWFFLLERKRRKYLLAIGPIIAAAFALVIAPAVNGARISRGTSDVVAADIVEAGRGLPDDFRRDPQDYLLRSFDYCALRLFIEPVAVGYIVSRVETEGLARGSELAYLLWAAVPRALWKDKPLVSRGEWFTSEIGFSMNEDASTTSTGMTSPGELYWNFGWPGVAAGMLFMGYLISRLLWRLALPDPRASLIAMLPYAHVLGNFMLYQDSEAGSSLLNILQAYLLFAAVAWIARLVLQTQSVPAFASRNGQEETRSIYLARAE